MHKLDERNFGVSDVLNVTKDQALVLADDFVDGVVNLSLLILHNILYQHSDINITVREVQLCGE